MRAGFKQAARSHGRVNGRKKSLDLGSLWPRAITVPIFSNQAMADRQAVIAQYGAIETCRIPVMSSIDDEKKYRALNNRCLSEN